ncbi:NlpE-like protein with OB domain [Nonlabens sp. Hel1_33_55]|uniref:hypothetical protein n=1 Tax=Nonlabens sp. Hel1_33_55 TaxID=1336802 RepID=UPI000875B050|nr:hypothetical protein [Nonlabens sp. Hel1_33_55]SCY31659.1 NlpE-like protein with OB domain [Nonlabens sp. Hel1_33_55]
MKAFFLSILFLCLLTGCKSDTEKSDAPDGTEMSNDEPQFKGEFIYLADAAVLSTSNDIYAVKIDDKLTELAEKAKEFQRTPYDMVQVTVTGELVPNPVKAETGEGWDQMIVIDKIIEVRKSGSSSVISAPAQEQEDN